MLCLPSKTVTYRKIYQERVGKAFNCQTTALGFKPHGLVFFPPPARGRLEGNCDGTSAFLMGPLAPDPVLFPGCYSGHTPPAHRPRINPDATHILERGQKGVVGDLLKLDGFSKSPVPKQSE